MLRQHLETAEDTLITEIGLLRDQAEGIVIDQFGLHEGLIVNTTKGGIHPGVLNGLQAKQQIASGQWLAVLEVHITTNGEGVDQLIITNVRSRYRELWAQL